MRREPHVRFCERAAVRFLRATHRNVYVRSERAGQRVMESISCAASFPAAGLAHSFNHLVGSGEEGWRDVWPPTSGSSVDGKARRCWQSG